MLHSERIGQFGSCQLYQLVVKSETPVLSCPKRIPSGKGSVPDLPQAGILLGDVRKIIVIGGENAHFRLPN